MIQKLEALIRELSARWNDEQDYEDFSEYKNLIRKTIADLGGMCFAIDETFSVAWKTNPLNPILLTQIVNGEVVTQSTRRNS